MRQSITSGQGPAVDAFLECVARCLAQRWLKIQRGSYQGEHFSDPLMKPTPVDHPLELNGEDSDGPTQSCSTEEARVAEQPDSTR